MTKLIIRVLSMLAFAPLLLEGSLRLFDPWRVGNLLADLRHLDLSYVASESRGYVLPAGHYQFSNWSAAILPDSTRAVPGTNDRATCTVVLLGDSMTFGMDVNDGDTWASLIARQLPSVRLINAGLIGYNLPEILKNYHAFPGADAYVYYLYADDERPSNWPLRPPDANTSYTLAYLNVLTDYVPPFSPTVWRSFFAALNGLASDSRVTLVAWNDGFGRQVAANVKGVHLIPVFAHRVSPSDGHPSAAGHAEIAAAMLPIVKRAVTERCTATF